MLARALQEVDLEEWSTDDESAFYGDFSTRLNRAYTKTKVHYARLFIYLTSSHKTTTKSRARASVTLLKLHLRRRSCRSQLVTGQIHGFPPRRPIKESLMTRTYTGTRMARP